MYDSKKLLGVGDCHESLSVFLETVKEKACYSLRELMAQHGDTS
jgi:hypothetical protein